MIFDERDRGAKAMIEAGRSKNLTPEQSLQAFFDMNSAVLKICIGSVKADDPKISEKRLLKEIKRIYSLRK